MTSGATPLSHIRARLELVPAFLHSHLTGNWLSQAAEALVTEVLNRLPVDIAFGTKAANFNGFDSDWFEETIFHELSHASHYSKVGATWYGQFVQAEINENVAHTAAS